MKTSIINGSEVSRLSVAIHSGTIVQAESSKEVITAMADTRSFIDTGNTIFTPVAC